MSKKRKGRGRPKKKGRPTKYKPAYCQNLINFFNVEPIIYRDVTYTYKNGDTVEKSEKDAAPTPFFSDWCETIKISQQTMLRWVDKYPDFCEAYKKAKQLQENFLIECALKNAHNATFTIFTMKNICGWKDKSELEHSGNLTFTQMGTIKIAGQLKDFNVGD